MGNWTKLGRRKFWEGHDLIGMCLACEAHGINLIPYQESSELRIARDFLSCKIETPLTCYHARGGHLK